MKEFAEKLKELRNEKGLTQMQVAQATGLSHTAIVNWENALRVPNANAVVILAKFYGVTTDYLLGVES